MKKRKSARVFAVLVFVFIFCMAAVTTVGAKQSSADKQSLPPLAERQKARYVSVPEKPSITKHQVTVNGKKIAYTATAGFMPFYDRKGEQKASFFYVAYVKEGISKQARRPLTFCYNGGPGSSSIWLHIAAFGPRTVWLGDGIHIPNPPYGVRDNPNTLLDLTDLVFIDPVGTGFSQAIPRDDFKKFWGVAQDIESVGQFIRNYVTENGRRKSPVFIAGESYGGIRTAGLSSYVQDMGLYPAGLIFISPALTYATMMSQVGLDVPHILGISEMATAAWYHHKIDPRFQKMPLDDFLAKVRAWSSDGYARALWKGNTLSPVNRRDIARQLSQYTSMPVDLILSYNLRVPMLTFMSHLLQDERKAVSYYDSRVTGPCINSVFEDDPLMNNISGPVATAFNAYLKGELKFTTLAEYDRLNVEVEPLWDWGSGARSEGAEDPKMGYPETVTNLARALRNNELLQVFVGMGMFDLACVHDATIYALNHLDIPRERLENIHTFTYPAGHMMYTYPVAHKKLKNDLSGFYARVLKREKEK